MDGSQDVGRPGTATPGLAALSGRACRRRVVDWSKQAERDVLEGSGAADQRWGSARFWIGGIVSEHLGHDSAKITWDTYQHVTPTMQADAAETAARLIFGTDA